MGMDVYGKAATDPVGEYFRNNVWWWHPLWTYCEEVVAPELCAGVSGHHNNGDGLDAGGALFLGTLLQAEIDSGRCAQYAADRAARLDALPVEPNGKRPFETNYSFAVKNVQEFANFLKHSGGFEIF
jgi:hypothetical protein